MVTEDRLVEVTERLRQFVAERQWAKFHNPKNLAMAIAGEAGELVAEFQWLTAEQSEAGSIDARVLERVTSEMADVAIYLLLLADRMEVDLLEAILRKVLANEVRFPAGGQR